MMGKGPFTSSHRPRGGFALYQRVRTTENYRRLFPRSSARDGTILGFARGTEVRIQFDACQYPQMVDERFIEACDQLKDTDMLNPYIAKQRAQFADNLKGDMRLEVCAMLCSEDEDNPIPVFEALLNRALYLQAHGEGQSIHRMLHGGFYGPINRGQLPRFMHQLQHNPHLRKEMDDAVNTVLSGSDVIKGHTDQGLPSDPGGHYEMAHSHVMIGGEVFGDWGGGPGGYNSAAAWRTLFEANATKALQTALNQQGANIEVDGIYGPDTLEATRAFQKKHDLDADGIVGPATWTVLNEEGSS